MQKFWYFQSILYVFLCAQISLAQNGDLGNNCNMLIFQVENQHLKSSLFFLPWSNYYQLHRNKIMTLAFTKINDTEIWLVQVNNLTSSVNQTHWTKELCSKISLTFNLRQHPLLQVISESFEPNHVGLARYLLYPLIYVSLSKRKSLMHHYWCDNRLISLSVQG